ncbi:hypothetical protein GQX74_007259 [Glossina fuscipes]|nr:hypothetical protein GQX74_007259 [Glossina fuscipes]
MYRLGYGRFHQIHIANHKRRKCVAQMLMEAAIPQIVIGSFLGTTIRCHSGDFDDSGVGLIITLPSSLSSKASMPGFSVYNLTLTIASDLRPLTSITITSNWKVNTTSNLESCVMPSSASPSSLDKDPPCFPCVPDPSYLSLATEGDGDIGRGKELPRDDEPAL